MVGDIEKVVAALERAGVHYMIVGGVAVVLHGHLRTTADLDLVVRLEPPHAGNAVLALSALGWRPRAPVPFESFADPASRASWMRDKGLTVFSLYNPNVQAMEIDLFVSEPFEFATVHGRAVRVQLEKTMGTVIALDDLIAMKRAAGRPGDLADIAALEAIRTHEP